MASQSHGFAIGRIRVLEGGLLSGERLERLLAAPLAEAMKVLQEIGYSQDASPSSYERLIDDSIVRACDLIKSVSPEKTVTDCFLLKYDILNLKALLKARCLGTAPEVQSRAGVFGPEKLAAMVREQSYRNLPKPLIEALVGLETRLSMRTDPRDIDTTLDRALYQNAKDARLELVCEPAWRYFCEGADLINTLMLFRAFSLKLETAALSVSLLPGGLIEENAFVRALSSPERIISKLRDGKYWPKISAAISHCISGTSAAPAYSAQLVSVIEKLADDYLLSIFKPLRYTQENAAPLIGYLLAREREAAAIRIVMVGKINGFSTEAIRERMRELYA